MFQWPPVGSAGKYTFCSAQQKRAPTASSSDICTWMHEQRSTRAILRCLRCLECLCTWVLAFQSLSPQVLSISANTSCEVATKARQPLKIIQWEWVFYASLWTRVVYRTEIASISSISAVPYSVQSCLVPRKTGKLYGCPLSSVNTNQGLSH